jgi:hypothetical protein
MVWRSRSTTRRRRGPRTALPGCRVEARRRDSRTRKATLSALFQPEDNQPRRTLARLRRRRKPWSRPLVRPRRTPISVTAPPTGPGRPAARSPIDVSCASARCPSAAIERFEGAYHPCSARRGSAPGEEGKACIAARRTCRYWARPWLVTSVKERARQWPGPVALGCRPCLFGRLAATLRGGCVSWGRLAAQ